MEYSQKPEQTATRARLPSGLVLFQIYGMRGKEPCSAKKGVRHIITWPKCRSRPTDHGHMTYHPPPLPFSKFSTSISALNHVSLRPITPKRPQCCRVTAVDGTSSEVYIGGSPVVVFPETVLSWIPSTCFQQSPCLQIDSSSDIDRYCLAELL